MRSVQYAAEAFGYTEPDWRALRSFVGPPLVESFARRYNVDAETAKAMCAQYRERYAERGLDECRAYPGVVELARRLRAMGASVAVATGKPTPFHRGHPPPPWGAGRLRRRPRQRVDGTRNHKWETMELLLDKFGRESAVMIGDRDNDVLSREALRHTLHRRPLGLRRARRAGIQRRHSRRGVRR